MFHITEEIILPNNIELKFPSSKVGAKSIFEGIVRDNNLGKSVKSLSTNVMENWQSKKVL